MSACTSPILKSSLLKSTLAAGLAAITFLTGLPPSMAADHGDAPFASVKRSGDLNDLYVFLDPNDNSRVAVILTLVGFTVPSEAVNFSVFDHELVYEFEFDTTFNARPAGGPADPGPFFAETHVRRQPPDGHHHLMPKSVHRVPADRQALHGADHVVQPRGQPTRAHDHPRPQRHPVLRRIGRRPLLLRHPGLQPLRRLGARGSPPIRRSFSAAGTASRAITPW